MTKHPDWPYVCDRFCKIHYYWDFTHGYHKPLPTSYNIKTQAGWVRATVFVGPPGYLPKKPTQDQMTNMEEYCPHTQGDLTCNNCLRYVFHPYTPEELS